MSRFVEEKKEPQIKAPRVAPLEGASAQSVFYYIPSCIARASAFICVHLRFEFIGGTA